MQPMPHPRSLSSLWRALGCAALAALATTCARDVNKGDNQEEPFPVQINIQMELDEDPSTSPVDNWYYFVFNFGTLAPTDPTKPFDQIVGPQRGRNWEM